MRGWLQVAIAGLLLFVATILVLLSAQGRMTYEGTRGIPVLAWFFSDPNANQPVLGTVETPQFDAPATDEASAERGSARIEEAAERETALPAPLGEGDLPDQFTFEQMDGGLTIEEIEHIALQAEQLRAEAERRLAAVREREADLVARARDLEDRDHAVRLQMERVETERRALDEAIEEFRALVLAVEQDEVAGLVKYARTLSSIEIETAVQVVMADWEDKEGGGRERIVKTFALMADEDASRILDRLPVDRVRELLVERLKVVDVQSGAVPDRGRR